MRPLHALALLGALGPACATAGSSWMSEPLTGEDWDSPLPDEDRRAPAASSTATGRHAVRVIGSAGNAEPPPAAQAASAPAPVEGRSLGTFRNTYYDFPLESDFAGPPVPLKNASCETISDVPRAFYESVCVQGSGSLKTGRTVSFAKRDCACAEVCPRTNQRICFDALDGGAFPWGRGATGKAITPLLTVAVDSSVIPLGTALYVPELEGLPRDPSGQDLHDGCFIAQDRGVRVLGKHLDVFTGHSSVTALWNRLMPSNRGVTVVLDSPRCRRASP